MVALSNVVVRVKLMYGDAINIFGTMHNSDYLVDSTFIYMQYQ